MTERNPTGDVARYAAAIRAALGDLDAAERADLLEDLEAHLAEVAVESGTSLADRLGPPDAYAAELRAAYGARPRLRRFRRLSRRWRLGYMSVFVGLVVLAWIWVAGPAGWLSRGDRWSKQQLLSQAQAGQVRSLDISGSSVTATDSDGIRHAVALSHISEPVVSEVVKDRVQVDYTQPSSSVALWLIASVPNLLLLLLIAVSGVAVYTLSQRFPKGATLVDGV